MLECSRNNTGWKYAKILLTSCGICEEEDLLQDFEDLIEKECD